MTNITEITRYKREGIKIDTDIQKLLKYAESNQFYIHFSDLNKLGINPSSEESTGPLGIYAYKLDAKTMEQIKNRTLPYAGDRQYAHIFQPIDHTKIVELGDYSQEQLNIDVTKLINIVTPYANTIKLKRIKRVMQYLLQRKKRTPGWKLWELTEVLSKRKSSAWSFLYEKLGYHGVNDPGFEIIHPNEPAQAVFFRKNYVQQVETLENFLFKEKELENQINAGNKKITDKGAEYYGNKGNYMLGYSAINAKDKRQYSLDSTDRTEKSRAIKQLKDPTLALPYIEDNDRMIRATVAEIIPEEYLYRLMNDEDDHVRTVVARRLPENELKDMIEDMDTEVRHEVVKRIPAKYLSMMIEDDSDYIREKVVDRLPLNLLWKMVKDGCDQVRTAIAIRIPIKKEYSDVIYPLLKDRDSDIRKIMKDKIRRVGLNPMTMFPIRNSDQLDLIRNI